MKFDHVCLEFTGSAHVTADLTGGGSADGVDWAVQDTADRFVFSLHAERETELHSVRARFSFPFEKKMRLFLNGYQSWTDSREHAVETLPRLEAAARGEKNGRTRRILSGKLHSIDSLPRALVERYAFDRYGDYGVQNWTDVLEVACGENGAVLALLADGTAIATGQNTNGECNVESWKDLRLPAGTEESK